MTFTPRDAKDVSALVAKKLELYMNYERRQERFDPQGYMRTTPKMQTIDLMYQVLEKGELDRKCHKSPRGSHGQRKSSKSPERKGKKSKKRQQGKSADRARPESGDDVRNGYHEDSHAETRRDEEKEGKKVIKPRLVENSRRVVPRREAERLTRTVNKVFEEQDLDKLHVIHRYRPNSSDVAPVTENGKVANYTMHVGSALHSKNYVEYYMREGLQSGNKDYSKRLQKLKSKKEKEEDNEGMSSKSKESDVTRQSQHELGKKSRMREILSPLASSSDSISSSISHSTPRNLTPISKGKPVYTTYLSSTPQSSRASAGKLSGSLPNAKSRSQEFGYHMVLDDIKNEDDEILGAGSDVTRQESRADVASSEDYCKFTSKNTSGSEMARDGDGKSVGEGVSVGEEPVKLKDVEMKYKTYHSPESSFLDQSNEDSRAHGNTQSKTWSESHRSGQSARSDRSGHSLQSDRSQKSISSIRSHRSSHSELISHSYGQPEAFDSTMSEDGSSTKRSFSSETTATTSQRRSKMRTSQMEPIRTVIESPEVPRLGLTSDINDSVRTYSSSKLEDYMTAEEKARIHPDTRAAEERINSSGVRAGEKDVDHDSHDKRAEVSLNRYSGDEDYVNTEEIIDSVPPAATEIMPEMSYAQDAEGETNNQNQSQNEQKNNEQGGGNNGNEGNNNEGGTQEGQTEETRQSEGVQNTSAAGGTSTPLNTSLARKGSGGARSDGTPTPVKPNRANEMEGSEFERGEDQVRNKELDRGEVPVYECIPKKKKSIERGDDTPRKMEEKKRLTVSARRRGQSDYHTIEDDERGLEKEYFEPIHNEKEEYFTSDMSARESELGSPPGSRPSSAASHSSQSTAKSDGKKKKKLLRRLSKASSTGIPAEIKEESRPQSAQSKDGRGDDSNSIKNGEGGDQQAGSNKSASHGEKLDDGEVAIEGDKDRKRPSSSNSQVSQGREASTAHYVRPPSASSRGSITAKEKYGSGQGYYISGDMLTRGLDDNSPRALEQVGIPQDDKFIEPGQARAMSSRKSSIDSQRLADHIRPSSRTSQASVKSSGSRTRHAEHPYAVGATEGLEQRPPSVASQRSDKNQVTSEVNQTSHERPPSASSRKSEGKEKSSTKPQLSERPPSSGSQRSVGRKQSGEDVSPEKRSSVASIKSNKSQGGANMSVEKQADLVASNKSVQDIQPNNVEEGAVNLQTESADRAGKEMAVTEDHTSEEILTKSSESHEKVVEPGERVSQIEKTSEGGIKVSSTFSYSGVNQEIPQQEKAFIESDSSEIIKGAVSGSVSLDKLLGDNETVIEFRPLSASTAKSVGKDLHSSAQVSNGFEHPAAVPQKSSCPQQSKIVEVSEMESHPAPERHYEIQPNVFSDVNGENVSHPGDKKLVKRESHGQILNLADVKIESATSSGHAVSSAIEHPAMRKASVSDAQSPKQQEIVSDHDKSTEVKTEGHHRPPSASSQKSTGKAKEIERPPSVSSEKSEGKPKEIERPPSVSSQRSEGKTKEIERPPSVSSQRSEAKAKEIERPPSVSSQRSEGKAKEVKRPPSVSSQRSERKDKEIERPPSISSQRSEAKAKEVERPPSVSSQRSEGKAKEVERPPSVSSQRSEGKAKEVERPPSVSSQRPEGKAKEVERPPSVSSPRTGGKAKEVERPPSVSSQRSEAIAKEVERPPSVSSQKSEGKAKEVERPPSVSSQRSEGKAKEVERPPSVSSQRSEGKAKEVERPPSVSSQRSEGKAKEVERPPSVSSQRSEGKAKEVERPPSVSSQRSEGRMKEVERPPSVSSQRSEGKVIEVERPPSVSSQRSEGKAKEIERPPSVSSQRSEGKAKEVERPPSVSSQRSEGKAKEVERPSSVSSQRSEGKAKEVERPSSVSSQRSEGKAKEVERPPSVSSQRSEGKTKDVETSPPISSHKSEGETKEVERPSSASSQRSNTKPGVISESHTMPTISHNEARALSNTSQQSEQKEVSQGPVSDENSPSAASQRSGGQVKVEERPPSVASQRSEGKAKVEERPPSAGSQRSEGQVKVEDRPPSVASQRSEGKAKLEERPPSAGSQRPEGKAKVEERPPSAGSQMSESKAKVEERPPSAGSQRSEGKAKVEGRPPSAVSQMSESKAKVEERPSSAGSQRPEGKAKVEERPPSAGSQMSESKAKVEERPPSAGSQRSEGKAKVEGRPPSAVSQMSESKAKVEERPSSAGSQRSEGKAKVEGRPPSAGSQKSEGKMKPQERPPSASSQRSQGKAES